MNAITISVKTKVPVRYLKAECQVRYWEDASVNDIEDTDGKLIPCRENDLWKPLIDLETGTIVNWEIGKAATIHYKVCDAGVYSLLDENQRVIRTIYDYVPRILSPGGSGYGDYVIMKVNTEGKIYNFQVWLDEFEED